MAGRIEYHFHILVLVDKLRAYGNPVFCHFAKRGILMLFEQFVAFFVRHPTGVFKVTFDLFQLPFPVHSATHKIQHFRVDELTVNKQAKPEKEQGYSVEIKVKDDDLV